VLLAIFTVPGWAGGVVDGEHAGFAGSGLRVAGVRRHLGHVGSGSALPVTFGEAREGREQTARQKPALPATAES
jgi:hypothetical protein